MGKNSEEKLIQRLLPKKLMGAANDCSGKRLFSRNEFLSSQQIQSFFSRVAAKRNVDIVTEEEKEEELSAHQEEVLSEMRSDVSTQVALHHPVMYDTYNICDLAASSGKLKATFSVSVLHLFRMMLRLSQNSVTTSNGKLENWLRNNKFILKWIRFIMTFSSYNKKNE